MADDETARRIAMSLPEAEDGSGPGSLHFSVRGKNFAWSYQERVADKQPRVPRIDVLAIRCAAADKDGLLAADPEKFFTTDHYRGFPAVLVRLAKVDDDELRELLTDGWRCQAPRSLVKKFDAGQV
jgi:hypothetical protein